MGNRVKTAKEATERAVLTEGGGAREVATATEKRLSSPSTQWQSSTKLRQVGQAFLSVHEAADLLGVSYRTVTRWCETGQLPAVPKPYGKKLTYSISTLTVEAFQQYRNPLDHNSVEYRTEPTIESLNVREHSEWFDGWVAAMGCGLISGRPYSDSTIEMYRFYVTEFLKSHKVVSINTLRSMLVSIPKEAWSKRFKTYKAVISFGKFLISEGCLNKSFLEEAKPFYPKRLFPPKRLYVTEDQLCLLIAAAKTPMERLILVLVGSTGLRASEATNLKRELVDLEKQELIVWRGKGKKTRPIGLTPLSITAIAAHYETVASKWVFSDEDGKKLGRTDLYHRLRYVGLRAGVKVSLHALRRAFVTHNANKGRPLPMLQLACGHSDIRTTMGYCMTTQQETVDAMKEWT